MIFASSHTRSMNELIKLEQSLFGLPFLMTGALLPFMMGAPFQLWRFWCVLVGFLLARTSGMVFNQLIDRKIDVKNPRTKDRPLPAKKISEKIASKMAWGTLIIFLFCALFLGWTLFILATIAALALFTYSYFKRFSASSHFVLGFIHALSTLMAFIVMGGEMGLPCILLALIAGLTISGSDILYALQDIAFDRKEKLFSIPARLGEKVSYVIGRALHFLALLMLLFFGISLDAGTLFFVAPFVGFFSLLWIHRKDKNPLLFNGVMSFITMIFTIGDWIWDVM